jgi:hypothetical protein
VYSGIEKPRNVAVRAVRQILDRFGLAAISCYIM